MKAKIKQMNLTHKKVLVVIGSTRAGKGTLLTALKGIKMKYAFREDLIEDSNGLFKEDDIIENKIMVPVDDEEKPLVSEMISHGQNSHTIKPSIVHGPDYPE